MVPEQLPVGSADIVERWPRQGSPRYAGAASRPRRRTADVPPSGGQQPDHAGGGDSQSDQGAGQALEKREAAEKARKDAERIAERETSKRRDAEGLLEELGARVARLTEQPSKPRETPR
jgi:hypothetical protein